MTHKKIWGNPWAMMAAFVALQLPYLFTSLPYVYDEGVYWQTLRLLNEGYRLYDEIFYSQMPVLLYFSKIFYYFSPSLPALRFGVVLISSLLVPAMHFLAVELGFEKNAKWVGLLAVINGKFFHQAHIFHGDAPSVALFVMALVMAFRSSREYGKSAALWAVLSALFFTLGLQMKLTIAPGAILIVGILFWRGERRNSVTFLATAGALLFSILYLFHWWPLGLDQLQGGSFKYLFSPQHTPPLLLEQQKTITDRIYIYFENLSESEPPNFLIPVVALFPWKLGYFLSAYFLVFTLALLKVKTVLSQHFVVYVPFFLLSLGRLLSLGKRFEAGNLRPWKKLIPALIFACALWDIVGYGHRLSTLAHRTPRQAQEEKIIKVLEDQVPADARMISANPALAAMAGRNLPPAFADTSRVRVFAGNIRCDTILDALKSGSGSAVLTGPHWEKIDCGIPELGKRIAELGNYRLAFAEENPKAYRLYVKIAREAE